MMRKRLIIWPALLLALYLFICIFFYFAQDNLLFFPRKANPQTITTITKKYPQGEKFWQMPDGKKIHGWACIKNPKSGVLFFVGNASEASECIQFWDQHLPDTSLFCFNYRGYGKSEGKPSEEKIIEDSIFIANKIQKDYLPSGKLFLLGRSLGSGVAVQVAEKIQSPGIILVTPYDSIAAVAKSQYPFLPVHSILKHPFDSLALAPKTTIPAYFIVAKKDGIIPYQNSKNLYDHWNGPKIWLELPNAGHNNIYDEKEVLTIWPKFLSFIQKY